MKLNAYNMIQLVAPNTDIMQGEVGHTHAIVGKLEQVQGMMMYHHGGPLNV